MPKRPSDTGSDRSTALARAALHLLADIEWPRLTLSAIARAAHIPLRDAVNLVGSKTAIAGVILRMVAQQTADRYNAHADEDSPRERLFAVTMKFFDLLQIEAESYKRLCRGLQYDPPTLLALRGDILALSGELLALAEADFGCSQRLQAMAFSGILLHAVSTWRHDDSHMGKTMAQLERDLRFLERFLWPRSGTAEPAHKKAAQARRSSRTRKSRR